MTITSDAIRYLQRNADKIISIDEIARGTSHSKQQIIAAISNKCQQSEDFKNRIERPAQGTIKYKSDTLIAFELHAVAKKTAAGNMYEQIGITKNGDLILQDEDGNLFRATELA